MTAVITTPREAMSCTEVDLAPSDQLNGFGGLHGGIALAIAARHLLGAAGPKPLRSLSARFLRPIRETLQISSPELTSGRMVDSGSISITSQEKTALAVHATLARSSMPAVPFKASPPDTSQPDDYDVFALPVEFVPFSQFMEIRPTTADRPFAGGDAPRLQAWIRLLDDAPVDLLRLIILFDSLAPSAAATLTDFVAAPTVELDVWPTRAVETTKSPWILLDASSSVSDDGWVTESLNAWTPDGSHLGSATQLRVMISR